MRDYSFYAEDILSAIEAIEKFIEGIEFEDFKQDDMASSAVIRKFEIIGEAAKHIPESIKDKYPEIPWKEMAGMRDKLIHFYFGVDYRLVWQTINQRLFPIKHNLRKIIPDIKNIK